MKLRVLAYTFSVPLVWAILLLLQYIGLDFGLSHKSSSAVIIGLLIGSLIARFFLNRKYLTSLSVDNEKIVLTYLTPLARQHQITIRFSKLTDIKLKKKKFLLRDFSSIKFFSIDNEITFHLMKPDTKQAMEQLAQIPLTKPVVSNA